MKDQFGRTIDYMRISITDRCNLRCRYCMPERIEWLPKEELLSLEEIAEICEEIPCGRMASAAETGDFIALLLEASPYMTGQIIGFDGGWGV